MDDETTLKSEVARVFKDQPHDSVYYLLKTIAQRLDHLSARTLVTRALSVGTNQRLSDAISDGEKRLNHLDMRVDSLDLEMSHCVESIRGKVEEERGRLSPEAEHELANGRRSILKVAKKPRRSKTKGFNPPPDDLSPPSSPPPPPAPSKREPCAVEPWRSRYGVVIKERDALKAEVERLKRSAAGWEADSKRHLEDKEAFKAGVERLEYLDQNRVDELHCALYPDGGELNWAASIDEVRRLKCENDEAQDAVKENLVLRDGIDKLEAEVTELKAAKPKVVGLTADEIDGLLTTELCSASRSTIVSRILDAQAKKAAEMEAGVAGEGMNDVRE
jgi:hypothetical protein